MKRLKAIYVVLRLTVDTVLPLRGTLLDRKHSPAAVDVRHAEGRVERAGSRRCRCLIRFR